MTTNKINELASFFYSSDDAADVPLRISATTGGYSGFDLSKESFIELLTIFNNSTNLKVDLKKFINKCND